MLRQASEILGALRRHHDLGGKSRLAPAFRLIGQLGFHSSRKTASGERLMVATGHIFEDTMATCHPPGIAGEVAGTSSPARPQECVHDGRRCGHNRVSSVLQCRHFRSSDFIVEHHHMFCQCCFAAMVSVLMLQHWETLSQRSRFWRWRTDGGLSTHTVSRNLGTFSITILASWLFLAVSAAFSC